jgi:hypothetical protein
MCGYRISVGERPQFLVPALRTLHSNLAIPTGWLGGHDQFDQVHLLGLGQQRLRLAAAQDLQHALRTRGRTRHGWRNGGNSPALVAAFIVGADWRS